MALLKRYLVLLYLIYIFYRFQINAFLYVNIRCIVLNFCDNILVLVLLLSNFVAEKKMNFIQELVDNIFMTCWDEIIRTEALIIEELVDDIFYTCWDEIIEADMERVFQKGHLSPQSENITVVESTQYTFCKDNCRFKASLFDAIGMSFTLYGEERVHYLRHMKEDLMSALQQVDDFL